MNHGLNLLEHRVISQKSERSTCFSSARLCCRHLSWLSTRHSWLTWLRSGGLGRCLLWSGRLRNPIHKVINGPVRIVKSGSHCLYYLFPFESHFNNHVHCGLELGSCNQIACGGVEKSSRFGSLRGRIRYRHWLLRRCSYLLWWRGISYWCSRSWRSSSRLRLGYHYHNNITILNIVTLQVLFIIQNSTGANQLL